MNSHLKNKKILLIGISVFLVVIFAVIAVTFISRNTSVRSIDENVRNVYFLNASTNEIVSEPRTVENGSTLIAENKKNEYVNLIKDELVKGPKNVNLVSTIPENVYVLSCKYQQDANGKGSVEINFSKEYNDLSESQELTCRGAIVKTFTELEFVNDVNILADGQEILRDNGQAVGKIEDKNVEINPSIEPYKTDTISVTLYFSDENAMGLSGEERSIEINEKESVETKIVEELIKGPKNESLVSVIPVETKINNINTEGGICYVDLSKDFIAKHNGGSTGESLTIYSIVNSLTELEQVKQVQFLIDGVKETSLAGHLDFSKTFERDESRILK